MTQACGDGYNAAMCTTTSSIESTATFLVSQPPTTLTSTSLLTHTISATCGGYNGPACPVSYSVPATTPTSTPEVATTASVQSSSPVSEIPPPPSTSAMTTSIVMPPTYGSGTTSTARTTAVVTNTPLPTPVPIYTGSGATNTVKWTMMAVCGLVMVLTF